MVDTIIRLRKVYGGSAYKINGEQILIMLI